jgi:hypothetical protein
MPKNTLFACALMCALSATAQAQIGSGWTSYSPSYSVQQRGCGTASGLTFKLSCSDTSGDQRAERRYASYSSGQHQFEGYVKITSFSGDRVSLKQTFQENNGAFFMLGAKHDGSLYNVNGGATLATGSVGTTFRVNTVHDVGAGSLKIYINGSQKASMSGGSSPWYDKIGTYRTGSGKGPITATWSNLRFWKK